MRNKPTWYSPQHAEYEQYDLRAARFIRDAIVERVQGVGSAWPGGAIKTVRQVQQPPLLPAELPAVSVFTLRETGPAKGQANTMIPLNYSNTSVIVVTIWRGFNDPIYLQGGLETDVLFVKNLLMTDVTFAARRWPNELFESIESIGVSYSFQQEGETYFAGGNLELAFYFQEPFVPLVTDRFQELDIRLRGPIKRKIPPQFEARFDMTQDPENDDED